MQITEMSPEAAKKARDGYEQGLLEMARSKDTAAIDELLAFAAKKGL